MSSWNVLKMAILTSAQSSLRRARKKLRMWSFVDLFPRTGARARTELAREAISVNFVNYF